MFSWKRALFFWICLVFALSPSARVAQVFLREHLGARGIADGIFGLFLFFGVALVVKVDRGLSSQRRRIAFFFCVSSLPLLLYALRKNPEEAFHVLEYGLLSWLFLKADGWAPFALSPRLTAAANASAVGVMEEFFQWILPNRIFDIRDIEINCFSAFLVQVALLPLVSPRLPFFFSKVDAKRAIDATLLLSLLLFLICFLDPSNLHRLTSVIPVFAALEAEGIQGGNELLLGGNEVRPFLQPVFFLIALMLGASHVLIDERFQARALAFRFKVKQIVSQ